MKYLIVIEETNTGFSAYAPDFDGCVATGSTIEDVEKQMKEAIEFHLEGLALEKLEKPIPHTYPAGSSYADSLNQMNAVYNADYFSRCWNANLCTVQFI